MGYKANKKSAISFTQAFFSKYAAILYVMEVTASLL